MRNALVRWKYIFIGAALVSAVLTAEPSNQPAVKATSRGTLPRIVAAQRDPSDGVLVRFVRRLVTALDELIGPRP